MKTKTSILAIIIVSIGFITSCKVVKKPMINATNNSTHNDKPAPKKKADIPKVVSPPKVKEVAYVPMPPEIVETHFKNNYQNASEVLWTKVIPEPRTDNKDTRDFKVIFVLLEKKNSALYAENGDLIEIRMQILPDQLPNNIHAAIKDKYSKYQIIDAYTLKNSRLKGAYIAYIKTADSPDIKEVILMDNGIFVE